MSEQPSGAGRAGDTAAAGSAGRPLLSRLRVRLIGLVLMAVLPALGLVLYTAIQQRRDASHEAAASAQRIVNFAATSQRQHVDASKQLLLMLTQLEAVHPDRPEEASALFRKLQGVYPIYANIGAIDAEGFLFASARTPTNSTSGTNRLYLGDRSYFRIARETQKTAVGEYQMGRVTGRPTVNIAQPLKDRESGRFLGVVYVAIDLGWLNQMARHVDLPDDSTLTLIDRKGTVLVRYSIRERESVWAGQSLTNRPEIMRFIKAGRDVAGIGRGLDGVRRLYSSTALSRTAGIADALVVVGIPVQVAYAAANQTLLQNLIILGIVAALALGAAWIASDVFVLKQVYGLVAAATRMRHGDLSARSEVSHGAGEIGQLARSFDEMAASLEVRVGELQRAEAELKTLNEELEARVLERTTELRRSNEDLEQFAYVASHDLQEPLRMITNYLQLLRQRYGEKLDPSAHDFIGFALDGSKRMHQLIHDLLTYSRVGTHGKELTPTSCEGVLADAMANLQLAIEESSAQVTHDPLPTVIGDEVQLTQLFQNLIGNAVKFRGEAAPKVHVGVERKGDEWEFAVSDNGIGIAEQDFQRIFIVFQRLHSREKYPGTGIGLSVCKKIVERHGGRIRVESKLGRGTTFYFTIPVM